MRLVRNTQPDGIGRFAIIRIDMLTPLEREILILETKKQDAYTINIRPEVIELSPPTSEEECFVIKLKDINAPAALHAYADECEKTDPEFALDIRELASRAENHPSRPQPEIPPPPVEEEPEEELPDDFRLY